VAARPAPAEGIPPADVPWRPAAAAAAGFLNSVGEVV
jgi:hypothetical protein